MLFLKLPQPRWHGIPPWRDHRGEDGQQIVRWRNERAKK